MAGDCYDVAMLFALSACAVTNNAGVSWGRRLLLLDNNQPVLPLSLWLAVM